MAWRSLPGVKRTSRCLLFDEALQHHPNNSQSCEGDGERKWENLFKPKTNGIEYNLMANWQHDSVSLRISRRIFLYSHYSVQFLLLSLRLLVHIDIWSDGEASFRRRETWVVWRASIVTVSSGDEVIRTTIEHICAYFDGCLRPIVPSHSPQTIECNKYNSLLPFRQTIVFQSLALVSPSSIHYNLPSGFDFLNSLKLWFQGCSILLLQYVILFKKFDMTLIL